MQVPAGTAFAYSPLMNYATPGLTPETLHGRFAAQVERTPDHIAVTCNAQHLSYQALDARATDLAWRLRELGVRSETLVAVCLERSLDLVVAILAVLKAGGAYVPIDPDYPVERQRFCLNDCQSQVLLTQRSLARLAPPPIQCLCLDDTPETGRPLAEKPLPASGTASSLAYVIYTSGSTGQPKGVEITHGNVTRLFDVTQRLLDFGPNDVWSLFHSAAFDFSVFELFGALLYGGRVVVVPREVARQTSAFSALLVTQNVTMLSQTPSSFQRLIPELLALPTPPPLRRVVFGGEALELPMLVPWVERFGDERPQLINMYGITETTVHVTYRRLTRSDIAAAPGSLIGHPLPDLEITLLDGQLRPVGAAEQGEIFISGPGVARGYLGRPELTAERFIRLPNGQKAYRSGDLARRLPDGELLYVGRADQQVKLHGYRIELGEIRSCLMAIAGIADAAVRCWGTGADKRLAAYLIGRPGCRLGPQQLRRELAQRLPFYMIPASFNFVPQLPLTVNGKLDLDALPPPSYHTRAYRAPESRTERAVTAALARVLKLDAVGRDDSVIALGGTSLQAAAVARELAAALGREIPVSTLLMDQTIAELAAQLDHGSQSASDAAEQEHATSLPSAELPVFSAQLGLWLHAQRWPQDTAYNETLTLVSSHAVAADRIERCLAEIIKRHESLRTSLVWRGGTLFRHIAPELTLPMRVEDVSGLPQTERAVAARTVAEGQAAVAFDLARPPLMRVCLVRMSERECRLYITVHHAVCDARSLYNLAMELIERYEADGLSFSLPPLHAHYAAAAAALAPASPADLGLPSQTGASVEPVLPSEFPRTEARSARGSRHRLRLPVHLCDSLRDLGAQEGATLFMVLLAAWHALLYRYSGSATILVGTVRERRPRAELLPLIGPFFSLLSTVTHPNAKMSFAALLAEVRRTVLAGLGNAPSAETTAPLLGTRFETVFGMVPTPPALAHGWEVSLLDVGSGAAKYDLALLLQEQDDGELIGFIEYRTALRGAASIARFCEHYMTLLASIAADQTQPLAKYDFLSAGERAQLLDWGAGQTDELAALHPCVATQIWTQAQRTPDATAVEWNEGTLTYRQLLGRAAAIADRLRQLGIAQESLIAVCLEQGPDRLAALLGVLLAGGAFVPLDPLQPVARLTQLLTAAAPGLLLTSSLLSGQLSDAAVPRLCVDGEPLPEPWEFAVPPSKPSRLAYVIYTSGSTGQPKGVQIEHAALSNLIAHLRRERWLSASSRVLQFARISFDAAVWEIFDTLTAGATLVLPGGPEPCIGANLFTVLRERAITQVTLPPAVAATLPAGDLPALETLICAGDDCPAEVVARWAPGRRFINAYGPTEGTVCATLAHCRPGQGKPPIGRPLTGVNVYVLDPQQQLVPIGVPGELYLGGAGLARGYLHDSALTARCFVTMSGFAKKTERLYLTGDRVRFRADGQLEFLGRVDRQLKLNGFRIEPAEIEATLREHPVVQDAVVVSAPGPDGQPRLCAYVAIPESAAPADPEQQFRRYLFDRLPTYMVPASIVRLAALPLTPHGKFDQKKLSALASSAKPADKPAAMEPTVAAIWKEVLALQRVDHDTSFFALGGDSLLLTQVHERLSLVLGRPIHIATLFQYVTIRALSQHLESGAETELTTRSNVGAQHFQRTLNSPVQFKRSSGHE